MPSNKWRASCQRPPRPQDVMAVLQVISCGGIDINRILSRSSKLWCQSLALIAAFGGYQEGPLGFWWKTSTTFNGLVREKQKTLRNFKASQLTSNRFVSRVALNETMSRCTWSWSIWSSKWKAICQSSAALMAALKLTVSLSSFEVCKPSSNCKAHGHVVDLAQALMAALKLMASSWRSCSWTWGHWGAWNDCLSPNGIVEETQDSISKSICQVVQGSLIGNEAANGTILEVCSSPLPYMKAHMYMETSKQVHLEWAKHPHLKSSLKFVMPSHSSSSSSSSSSPSSSSSSSTSSPLPSFSRITWLFRGTRMLLHFPDKAHLAGDAAQLATGLPCHRRWPPSCRRWDPAAPRHCGMYRRAAGPLAIADPARRRWLRHSTKSPANSKRTRWSWGMKSFFNNVLI